MVLLLSFILVFFNAGVIGLIAGVKEENAGVKEANSGHDDM